MKKTLYLFTLCGFISGVFLLFMLESIRIGMANEMIQEIYLNEVNDLNYIASSIRNNVIKSNEATRLFLLPLFIMLIGGLSVHYIDIHRDS